MTHGNKSGTLLEQQISASWNRRSISPYMKQAAVAIEDRRF